MSSTLGDPQCTSGRVPWFCFLSFLDRIKGFSGRLGNEGNETWGLQNQPWLGTGNNRTDSSQLSESGLHSLAVTGLDL